MSRKHRRPAKALNLLIALAMVISLVAVLAPTVVMAQPTADLDVAITDPTDLDMCIGEVFTVGANVTCDGANSTSASLITTATLTKREGDCVTIIGNPVIAIGTLVEGEMAHVSWLVRCNGGGEVELTVTAESSNGDPESKMVAITQGPSDTVTVDTYVVVGDSLVPQSTFNSGDVFYVNAALTNTRCTSIGNYTDPVFANIDFSNSNVQLHSSETGRLDAWTYPKVARADGPTENPDGTIGSRRTADVWWRVVCTGEGTTVIRVNSTINNPEVGPFEELAEGDTEVLQGVDHVLRVNIIEPIWDSETPDDPIEHCVSQHFVIKAELWNDTGSTVSGITAYLENVGPAQPIDYGPGQEVEIWNVGSIDPYSYEQVSWQLHCVAAGGPHDVVVDMDYSGQSLDGQTQDDYVTYMQAESDAALSALLTSDKDRLCSGPEAMCGEWFVVSAPVTNSGCNNAVGVTATLSVTMGSGNVSVDDVLVQNLGTIGRFATETATWDVQCIGPGAATFEVVVNGTDEMTAAALGPVSPPVVPLVYPLVVEQLPLKVDILMPAPPHIAAIEVPVGQPFTVEAKVQNCTGAERDDVGTMITLPPGTILNPDGQTTVQKYNRFGSPDGSQIVYEYPPVLAVNTPLLCPCCWVIVTWDLLCSGSTGIADVTVTATDNGEEASYSIEIDQQCKAHLVSGIETFEGDLLNYPASYAPPSTDAFVTLYDHEVSEGDFFTVVVPVHNVGVEQADNVVVDIEFAGNAVVIKPAGGPTDDPLPIALGNIPGGETKKAVWLLQCTGPGFVDIDIFSLTGDHHFTGSPILESNIDDVCPVRVIQEEAPGPEPECDMTVTILNPDTSLLPEERVVDYCEFFVVKAIIENTGETDMTGVYSYIQWSPDLADLAASTGVPQDYYQEISGPLAPGAWAEVAWTLHCTGNGDMTVYVYTYSNECATVTETVVVRQFRQLDPDVGVQILSPDDYCMAVATGEEFMVTARLNNSNGLATATNVYLRIDSLGSNYELVDSPSYYYIGDMVAGQGWTQPYSWTVRAVNTGQIECDWDDPNIRVYVTYSNSGLDPVPGNNYQYIYPYIYPAANLIAEIIDITPATTIGECDEFSVIYRINNTGQADAWDNSVTLSVEPEGSVRIAEGAGGYTQYIGGLTGWDADQWSGGNDYYIGQFDLHCKLACESTLTITPAGSDECGWEVVPKFDETNVRLNSTEACFDYSILPGRAIPAEQIMPASQTVKQIESGGLDLGIVKTVNDPCPAPEFVLYTITVTNYGPTDATGVVVNDDVPAPLDIDSVEVPEGYGDYDEGTGIWDLGNLIAGASATMTIHCTYDSGDDVEGLTNTATITAVDQPDGYPANDEDAVTICEEAVTLADVALTEDWNLVSLPLIPDGGGNLTSFFAGIASNMDSIWAYDPTGGWTTWAPGWGGDLTEVTAQYGYWIDMDSADTLSFTGVELESGVVVPPAYPVSVGWNLIGFKSTTPMAAGDYLNALADNWVRMYGYADGMYSAVQSGNNMMPGMGYWLAATAAGTIYP